MQHQRNTTGKAVELKEPDPGIACITRLNVILDVVFNHTAEGNELWHRLFRLKDLTISIYYMLTPDGKYYNFSGCGNTVNCNHPVVQQDDPGVSAILGGRPTVWTASGLIWHPFLEEMRMGHP